MKKFKSLSLCLLIPALIFSCGREDKPQSEGRLRAVTSIFPIADIAARISGGRIDVFHVIPSGANPHTFEPLPSIAAKIHEARIFIGVDREYDGWIEKFLPRGSTVRYLQDSIARMKTGRNPHIWLSLKGGREIARSVADWFGAADPAGRETYKRMLDQYLGRIDALDKKIAAEFLRAPRKDFVQWHPAWNYLAEDYGLDIVGTIEHGHGESISVRGFRDLVGKAGRKGTKIVVLDLAGERREAEAFARDIGGILVRLDPIGDPDAREKSGYLELIEYNTRTLARAFAAQGKAR